MSKRMSIAEQLRRAVNASGLSRAELCRRAGMDQGYMSRVMSGRQPIGAATLNRLADALGLELRPTRRASRKGNEHGKAK